MNRVITRTDSEPWYRQFWPWFLIMLPASVVIAALTTVYIANRHADDLVVDEYYKDGLAINRELAKIDRADVLGIGVDLKLQDGQVQANVTGPVIDARLSLQLSHPIEADNDLELSLLRIGDGLYSATLPDVVRSRWHWVIESTGSEPWRTDGVLQPDDFTDARPD
ncbi:MAG: FixH family protein [Halioglobus sp.]